MNKTNALLKLLLISGLLLLAACGDTNSPDGHDSHSEETADNLNMSVVSSSIIELDWQETEYPHSLFRRDDGGAEQLVYEGENHLYQDDGLQTGVMYCYQLKVCGSECSPVSNSACSTTREWKSHGQAPWSARRYHASVVFKDKIWLMGGGSTKTSHQTYNDVWSFDGSKWLLVTDSASWSPRSNHTSVVFKDKIWLLGGERENGDELNDIWSSIDGENWERDILQAPWSVRDWHSSFVFKDKIWILGGEDSSLNAKTDVWSSTDSTNWQLVTAQASWPGNRYHNFLVFQDKIWMLEGDDWYITETSRNIWTSSDGKNWQKTPISGTQHWVNEAIVFKNRVWLIGGFYGEAISSEVWLSQNGLNWIQDATAPWPGRYGHASVVFQDKIWIFGGKESFPNHLEFNDVWSY